MFKKIAWKNTGKTEHFLLFGKHLSFKKIPWKNTSKTEHFHIFFVKIWFKKYLKIFGDFKKDPPKQNFSVSCIFNLKIRGCARHWKIIHFLFSISCFKCFHWLTLCQVHVMLFYFPKSYHNFWKNKTTCRSPIVELRH